MAGAPDSNNNFNILLSKISKLSLARTQNDRELLNSTLNSLNSLNYKYPVVANPTKAVLLIHKCCSLIQPEDAELVPKCCQLIINLVTHQNVAVDGRTLTVAVLWCLEVVNHGASVEVLGALDALVRDCSDQDLKRDVMKSGPLLSLARNLEGSEATLCALQCLEACTVSIEDVKSESLDFQACFSFFLQHCTKDLNISSVVNIKVLIVCLRGLQNIVKQKPELLSENLGIILGIIKSYMLVGIPGVDFVKPQRIMPSPLSIPEAVPQNSRDKIGKMAKNKKPKMQANIMKTKKLEKWDDEVDGYSSVGSTAKTSDSEFSDTEGGHIARLAALTSKLRQTAMGLLLHTLTLTDKTVMFSYWSTFVPENPLANKHNLITCILKETTNRGRMAALNALLMWLSSSKLFLAQAEKGDNLAFTPFSVILGLTIKELHRCLSLTLTAISVPVLTLILKCFAALVQATPYHRLNPGLVTKVVRNVKSFIYHKDSTVQVSALIVLGSVLSLEPQTPEIKQAFTKNLKQVKHPEKNSTLSDYAEFSSEEEEEEGTEDNQPWLLQCCLQNIDSDTLGTSVKMESLQLVSIMSCNHFEVLLAPCLSSITRTLDGALACRHSDVQLHAARTVDFLGQAMTQHPAYLKQSTQFWTSLLNGALIQLLQSDNATLRAVACDCLASIGNVVYEQLARDKQILCVTMLFACSRDEESAVKAAAVRALGVYVLYQFLREDLGFVVDTTDSVLRLLTDENCTVREKCSWALGSLTDVLVQIKADEEFPEILLIRLLKAALGAARDGNKVRMNVVRALGNLLQLIDDKSQLEGVGKEGIDVLVKNCTSGSNMKVRWNSCYALGNAMKNELIFGIGYNWDGVFAVLTDLVVNFRNFKVRINAACALAAPKQRNFYGQCYQPVWAALVRALETAENMEDFTEYKHRDNLIEQICLTIGHLVTKLSKDDLNSLKTCIFSDHLKRQMRRVWDKLLPEKSTTLCDAHAYLTSFRTTDLNTDQKETLQCLCEIIKTDSNETILLKRK